MMQPIATDIQPTFRRACIIVALVAVIALLDQIIDDTVTTTWCVALVLVAEHPRLHPPAGLAAGRHQPISVSGVRF